MVQAQQTEAPQSVQPVTTTLLLFHSIRLLAQKLLKLLPTLSGTQPLPLAQLQRQPVLPRQLLEQQQVLQLVAVEVPVVPGLRPVDQLEVPVVLVKVVRLRPSRLPMSATATSAVVAEISGGSGRRSG
jgi:hypothetical protein